MGREIEMIGKRFGACGWSWWYRSDRWRRRYAVIEGVIRSGFADAIAARRPIRLWVIR